MSVCEGMRALRGAPGSQGVADDHPRQRRRSARRRADARGRAGVRRRRAASAAPGVGYLRVAAIGAEHRRPGEDAGRRSRRRTAPRQLIVDVRRTSGGVARQRPGARAAVRRTRARWRCAKRRGSATRDRSPPRPATARSRCRRSLLVDTGTSGAAELFASALSGNKRAELDRRAHDRPRRHHRSWSSCRTAAACGCRRRATSRPTAAPLHEKGLEPDRRRSTSRTSSSASRRRPTDPILDKALEQLCVEEGRVDARRPT